MFYLILENKLNVKFTLIQQNKIKCHHNPLLWVNGYLAEIEKFKGQRKPSFFLYRRVHTPLLRPPQHWVVFATETGLALTSPGESSETGTESGDIRSGSESYISNSKKLHDVCVCVCHTLRTNSQSQKALGLTSENRTNNR